MGDKIKCQVCGSDKIDWKCKACVKEYNRVYFKKHHRKLIRYMNRYAKQNAEKLKQYRFNRYHENVELSRALANKYHKDHPEVKRKSDRKYYRKNREVLLRKRREYGKKHSKRLTQYSHEWAIKNKDKRKKIWARYNRKNPGNMTKWRRNNPGKAHLMRLRRIKYINNGGEYFTADEWSKLVKFYCPDRRCLACGKRRKLTVDHVVPVTKNGKNSIDNIQPLCRNCNSTKRNKTIEYRPDGGKFAREINKETNGR